MVYFSINAYKYILGLDDSYRLCKDKTWKQQPDFKKIDIDQDMLFSNYKSAEQWLDSTGTVEINGEQADTISKEESDLVKQGFDFEIVVHRTSPLNKRYFIREQIKDVLMAGNDSYWLSDGTYYMK